MGRRLGHWAGVLRRTADKGVAKGDGSNHRQDKEADWPKMHDPPDYGSVVETSREPMIVGTAFSISHWAARRLAI